jgi:hypothetical protein
MIEAFKKVVPINNRIQGLNKNIKNKKDIRLNRIRDVLVSNKLTQLLKYKLLN